MEQIIFDLAVVFQASAIALGVGSSTLAITNFLVAIFDGKIDEGERRIMGVTYHMLRFAMYGIAVSTALIYWFDPNFMGPINAYMALLVVVLFANAYLMTKHIMPSKVGPALQAATWYTLGFLMSLFVFKLMNITPTTFLILYAADIAVALIVVNGYLKFLQSKKQ